MDEAATTRSDARRRRARRRLAVILSVVAVVVLAAGIGIASCSGGDSDDVATTSTTKPATKVDIPLGPVTADSAGPPVTVTPEQAQHVLETVTAYVKSAIAEPMRSGKQVTADLATVFDPATLASATTTDRAVVLDEGLPRVTGNLTVTAPPVAMVGLGDQAGNLTLVTASLALDASGTTKVKGDPLHVARTANLVLQPDATGAWKITAYDMTVTRDGAGLTPTTTTAKGTTTTTEAKK